MMMNQLSIMDGRKVFLPLFSGEMVGITLNSNDLFQFRRKKSSLCAKFETTFLKLVSAIFYQIFISSRNDSPSKTVKSVFYFI